MMPITKVLCRPAEVEDRRNLASLIQFETYVHRHLDWRPPLDWLGHEPYLVAEKAERLVAALACPPDPPGIAWIRMFAATVKTTPEAAWEKLWPMAHEQLRKHPSVHAAAIPLHGWFRDLLQDNGFTHTHNVIVLAWENSGHTLPPAKKNTSVRSMTEEDLEKVLVVDEAAFGTLWRNSLQSIELAFSQAAIATVAENENGEISGYQISTPSPTGAHLARLAVHPETQGQGVGYALVRNLLLEYKDTHHRRISVNTQNDNQVSLSLYEKAGFQATGDEYPVYQFEIS
ncbi:MAG: GNAT family N-acetyltransferase [Chloroflexi bacterium]|nr:GNAT family N-acetyltransferase [Chloroflexota bacterium]